MLIKPRNNVFKPDELGGQVVCSKMEHTIEHDAITGLSLTQALKNKRQPNED